MSKSSQPRPFTRSVLPVCAVTGGSSGIGLATAQLFAARDYAVSICGRDSERLAAAASSLPATQVSSFRCDLAIPAQARQFVRATAEHWGRIDVLVHCGAAAPLAPMADLASNDFEAAIDVNLRGWFHATQEAWRYFLRHGTGGTIVSVSSLAAIDPFPGFAVYGACKAWQDLMVQALAAEGKPLGIRLYSIRPGTVDTPLLDSLFPDVPPSERLAPHQVAELIWEVCQEPFRYSSGQSLVIRR